MKIDTQPEGRRMKDSVTGAEKYVNDARFDLIPPKPLVLLARVYGMGALKYAPRNWEAGYSWGWSFAALMRHAWAFWRGEDSDPESGLPHLAHAAWHCFTLMEFTNNCPEKDDRSKAGPLTMPTRDETLAIQDRLLTEAKQEIAQLKRRVEALQHQGT